MGNITVHEFITLDGVIETPSRDAFKFALAGTEACDSGVLHLSYHRA